MLWPTWKSHGMSSPIISLKSSFWGWTGILITLQQQQITHLSVTPNNPKPPPPPPLRLYFLPSTLALPTCVTPELWWTCSQVEGTSGVMTVVLFQFLWTMAAVITWCVTRRNVKSMWDRVDYCLWWSAAFGWNQSPCYKWEDCLCELTSRFSSAVFTWAVTRPEVKGLMELVEVCASSPRGDCK